MTLQTLLESAAENLPPLARGRGPLVTTAYKKNDGRIFGGEFLDGISNAVDAVSMIR